MKTFVFRGTPVTCARDAQDLLYAAGQDLTFSKVRIGSDMLVNAAVHNTVRINWLKLAAHALTETEVRFTGHSLGACHALDAASFLPRSVVPRVFAFAPFQFCNRQFASATYGGRPDPRLYGRAEDFAPGWDHLDSETCPATAITHLLGGGKTSSATRWPLDYESVEDHDVDLYAADLAEVPGEEEAALLCRLSSAVYLEAAADVISKVSALGFRTLDIIESPGFRCAVLEET